MHVHACSMLLIRTACESNPLPITLNFMLVWLVEPLASNIECYACVVSWIIFYVVGTSIMVCVGLIDLYIIAMECGCWDLIPTSTFHPLGFNGPSQSAYQLISVATYDEHWFSVHGIVLPYSYYQIFKCSTILLRYSTFNFFLRNAVHEYRRTHARHSSRQQWVIDS